MLQRLACVQERTRNYSFSPAPVVFSSPAFSVRPSQSVATSLTASCCCVFAPLDMSVWRCMIPNAHLWQVCHLTGVITQLSQRVRWFAPCTTAQFSDDAISELAATSALSFSKYDHARYRILIRIHRAIFLESLQPISYESLPATESTPWMGTTRHQHQQIIKKKRELLGAEHCNVDVPPSNNRPFWIFPVLVLRCSPCRTHTLF